MLDATAVTLCMENDLPIVVFDMNQPGQHPRGGARRAGSERSSTEARRAHDRRHPSRALESAHGARRRGAWSATSTPIRTGRAVDALVERIQVEYYGTPTPLNQLASISVPEAHQIVIQPWDRSALGAIEKAIQKSDVGLVPNVDGTVVRLNIPPLTEERRKDLVKLVHKRMEEARVEIRNHRREAADEHQASRRRTARSARDEARREQERSQKLTDRWIDEVDRVGKHKEQEIMEVG